MDVSIPLLLEGFPWIDADPVFVSGRGVGGRSGLKFDSLPYIMSQVAVFGTGVPSPDPL